MNKYIAIGLLGSDPEALNGGCKLSLAVQYFNGKEKTVVWIKVLVFGKAAENCLTILKKGRRIIIEGRLDRATKNNELIVVTDNVQFL